jgi:hypothetical protein
VLGESGTEPLHQGYVRKLILACLFIPVKVPDRQRQHRRPDMSLGNRRPQQKLTAAKLFYPLGKEFCLFFEIHKFRLFRNHL